MKYIDKRKEEEKRVDAEVGDFMLCMGTLRVFIEYNDKFLAVEVEGVGAFHNAMFTGNSIQEILDWYDRNGFDYEIIPAEELKIVRV